MAIRLVLADSQPLVLDGLERFCAQQGDLYPVARCHDGAEALDAIRRHRPDIVLLDLPLKNRDGFAVLREVKQENLPTRPIILTAALHDEQALEVMRLGVPGVFLKTMSTELLAQCIRKVHAGGQWLEKQSFGSAFETLLLREAGARRLATILTPREIETMRLVAKGLSNRQVAEQLHLKEGTVKIHLHNIYKKLGFQNRVDLSLYAKNKGLI